MLPALHLSSLDPSYPTSRASHETWSDYEAPHSRSSVALARLDLDLLSISLHIESCAAVTQVRAAPCNQFASIAASKLCDNFSSEACRAEEDGRLRPQCKTRCGPQQQHHTRREGPLCKEARRRQGKANTNAMAQRRKRRGTRCAAAERRSHDEGCLLSTTKPEALD